MTSSAATPVARPADHLLGGLRVLAALAAAVLGVAGVGDVMVLAGLLALASAAALPALGAVLAGLALASRWGSTSLAAVTGGQGVLGPGLLVGSVPGQLVAVASAVTWLLAVPGPVVGDRSWRRPDALITAIAFGAAAALALAAPAGWSGAPLRSVAVVAGTLTALVSGRALDWAGRSWACVGSALIALVAAGARL